MPTPYQLAIQQINQKYAGTKPTSAPLAQPNIAQKAMAGAANIYNAPGNFFSNLQDHLVKTGVGLAQGVGQAFNTGVDALGSAMQPMIQNTDPNSPQYAPSKSVSQLQSGTDPVAQDPRFQQMKQDISNNQQTGGFGAGLKTGNAATQALILNPTDAALQPVSEAWQGITSKLNPVVDFLSGKPQGTTQISNDQAGQQATQAYKQWADQNPKAALGLETLSTQGQGGMAIAGATQGLEGVKEGYNRLQSASEAKLASTPAPVETTPKIKTPKLSPEQQDIQNNITQTQKEVEQAKSQADFAAEQRKTATPQAVQGVKDINTKVAGNIKTLGEQFGNEATQLEKAQPNAKLNLTNEQINALNNLKENKNFSLPKELDNSNDVTVDSGTGKFGNVKLTGKALQEFEDAKNATSKSLTPTKAQELIKELNRSTFRQNADGSITKDYQRLGITNEIKSSASQAFGPKWDKIYSKYSQGRGMVDKLDGIANLDSKATPEDLNKQLEGILKQSKTPEGKLLLQQAVDEYKQSSGVDLNNPIKTIQGIADKQTALEEANSNLSDAQKAANKAQREADIAQLKQEQKMSTFKGRHPTLTKNMEYEMKRAVWGLTGGAVIGALGLSGLLKKIFK